MRTGILAMILLLVPAAAEAADTITVGAKNFAENRLLAEMAARLIEERSDLRVRRLLELAGTRICFEHLLSGQIDFYPEYTGTGLVEILGAPPMGDRLRARAVVKHEFLSRWKLRWLPPLGFENSYEIAVSRAVAEQHGLRTISDLARVSGELVGGFGLEFIERDDGIPGLERTYGLKFGEVLAMQQALKYEAVANRQIQCLDVYTTQGRLSGADVVILEDDLGFFPPYEAAFVVRVETVLEYPELVQALEELSGTLDRERMQRLNFRVERGSEKLEDVAEAALRELGLLDPAANEVTAKKRESLLEHMWSRRLELFEHTFEHLLLTGIAVLLAVLVAIPLGLFLEGQQRWAPGVIRVIGVTQTIPALALLAFMLPVFAGLRLELPAIAALWIYALFPILNNTFVGVRDADPAAVDAATALGMTRSQVLSRVRLPLALPIILTGVRVATVIAIGTATLGAFVGAGGLGVPIIKGVQLFDTNMILSGAIPAALLAVGVDGILALVERWLRPPALKA